MSSSHLLGMGIGGSALYVQGRFLGNSFWDMGLQFFAQYLGVLIIAFLIAMITSSWAIRRHLHRGSGQHDSAH